MAAEAEQYKKRPGHRQPLTVLKITGIKYAFTVVWRTALRRPRARFAAAFGLSSALCAG